MRFSLFFYFLIEQYEGERTLLYKDVNINIEALHCYLLYPRMIHDK